MLIGLRVTWEGDVSGIAEGRLSLGAFGQALTNLLLALRRMATTIVSETLGDKQTNVGRFTNAARQLDIEITSLVKDSCGFESLVTLSTVSGEHFPPLTDLAERASRILLDALEAESRGVPTHADVRRYLESLPGGITQQTYGVYRDANVLREISLGPAVLAQGSADLPYLAEYVGHIVGVGFEPAPPEVQIKTDTTTVILEARPDQVETALKLRHSSVRAMAVVQGHAARLLLLQEAHAPIDRTARESAIFERWEGVLRRLAQ